MMSDEKECKTEILGGLDAMQNESVRILRAFSAHLKKDTSTFALTNSDRLRRAVLQAKKSFYHHDAIPVSAKDGMPYLFRVSQNLLSAEKGILTEKAVGETLAREAEKHRFYDEELLLLPSFLIVSAAELYAREGKIRFAEAILSISEMNFSAYFFAFSEVERIFCEENADVYRNVDAATKNLYHARLRRLTKREKSDPFEAARKIVESANQKQTHIGSILPPYRGADTRLYVSALFTLSIALLFLFACLNGAGYWNLVLLLPIAFPIYAFSKIALEPVFSRRGERTLPRLTKGDVLEQTRVLVSVATFLFGEEKDGKIFDRLEDFYLTNRERGENTVFAVIGDLPQSKKRTTDKDAAILSYAEKRIQALLSKYGPHFALFIRGRRRSESEDAYIGWERKRGSVLELCRFLRGKPTSFILEICERDFLSEVKYLITLDADTNLYAGAVRDMLGIMLHPENRPCLDPETNTVISGHAVLQPRMTTTLTSASSTAFAEMTGGAGGIDVYAAASSDLYQSIFDEGIYCGKGIMDVDVFLAVCDGFFPRERILSHDLAEGNLLRAGLATDIVLTDGTPKNAISYYIREHRWFRGDLQIAPYLFRRIQNERGEYFPNPMSRLSKYKILDNLLRAATPLMSVLALLTGCLLRGRCALWTAVAVFLPTLWQIACAASRDVRHHGMDAPMRALSVAWFHVSALAYEAFLFMDALVRTLYRFTISHKNFLGWTTASSGDSAKKGYLDDYILRFSPSMMIGLVFFCVSDVIGKLLGVFWMMMPIAFWLLSRERRESQRICVRDREALMRYTHDAWLFFRDHVNLTTKGLPPDNIQLSPTFAIARRTSPTNIGLYLLSLLSARDFGFIDSRELYERSSLAAKTVKTLFKWNGHLYNWYSLDTLEVLGDAFVSTVDSGNFVTSLVAFCEGAKEYAAEATGLLDVISDLEKVISETDFSALYDRSRDLFYIGYDGKQGAFTNAHYDTFMSESRLTSYYATAVRAVPREHYFKGARRVIGGFGDYGIASWSGTAFEFFMPSLLLPKAKDSLISFSLSHAYRTQKRKAVSRLVLGKKHTVFGVSESGYFAFDGAMNYQYHAFGTESLSLDPEVFSEPVIAPYASFLMLEEDPERVAENLTELESLGMYGKYGFYEAIDFEPSRVGGGYARIQSFMSHHLGMSIVAVSNLLHDGIFRRRFMKNPSMRASGELLLERMPHVLIPYSVKHRIRDVRLHHVPAIIQDTREASYPYTLLHPEMALISNHKTKILASSSGHIAIENGSMTLSYSSFDLYELMGGFRMYVNVDGAILPTVPLMSEDESFSSQFSFSSRADAIVYRSQHRNAKKEYTIILTLSVLPDKEICEISCEIFGEYQSAYACLYFEPVLADRKEYLAHKSFLGLFLESEYHADEGVLLLKRRPRSDELPYGLLGVSVLPRPSEHFFETMRDRVLPLMCGESAYRSLAKKRELSDSTGALVIPSCVLMSAPVNSRKRRIRFALGTANDEDDLLYELSGMTNESRRMRKLKTGDLLQLQYSAAGLSRSVAPLEHFILRSMAFGQIRPRLENHRHIDKNAFWRFSISGDNPIVLAKVYTEGEEETMRLRELLGLFKYMCIRGIRYDLVLLYRERDGYNRSEYERLLRELRRAGCENFISWSCGIFCVDEGSLTLDERFAYDISAAAILDVSVPLRETALENARAVPISAELERLLKREVMTVSLPSEKPYLSELERLASGSFHENGFLIRKPHGNAPFAHVLASQNFGSVLTENSLGFTFARNAGLGKLTPHTADAMSEDRGERLLLRIYDLFGMQYRDYDLCAVSAWVDYTFEGAVYYGTVCGIRFSISVNLGGKADIKMISVSLESEKRMRLALIFAVYPALGERADANRFYRFCKEKDGLRISHFSDGGMKRGELLMFSPDATACYTDTAALRSDGAVFRGESDVGVLLSRMELFGKRTVCFYLGAVFSERHDLALRAYALRKGYPEDPKSLCQTIVLRSQDVLLDEIVNKWSVYQTLYARIYARSGFYQVSGAYGFRDQLQDAMALIQIAPNITKTIIFRAAAHQYEEGDVQHFWHPTGAGLRTRCSDDFLWLAYVTAEYIKQTGDIGILKAEIAYLQSPVLAEREEERYESPLKTEYKESLWAHIKRAVARAERFGAHGLPLFGSGDWNDGMNTVGKAGRGESVWLAFFLVLVWERMIYLCEMLGEETRDYQEKQLHMLEALRLYGYDGAWYRRGYYDDGTPLGSDCRCDCKIDAIAQAFAAIVSSELGFERERAMRAMASVEEHLFDREHQMIHLLTPPFMQDVQSPGYIKGYVAGIRENGGQYTHAAVWSAIGAFSCGKDALGAEMLFAITPALRARDPRLEKAYRIEPYVFAGDVYANPSHIARGGWSWYTGSAAWYRRAVLEWLCGYREDGEGFTLAPHLSQGFSSFSLEISKRDTHYTIDVSLGKQTHATLDGCEILSTAHFLFDGGKHHVRLEYAENT